MGVEQLAMSSIAAIGKRPRVSQALFGFTKWGNPFAAERFSWPYPMYDRMRADGEVVYSRAYRQWFVMGYDEVQQVLRSDDCATSPIANLLLSTRQYRTLTPSVRTDFSRWLLATDPPDHTRLRSAVARAFTPKQIAGYEPLVRKVADELLSELPESGEVDIVDAFTMRLPIELIAELLGLPAERREWLQEASRVVGSLVEPFAELNAALINERFAELDAYFLALIEERRQFPGDDIISALASESDGPVLDADEIVAMIVFLLFAGHETVTGMLGNALVAFAACPEQRALLRDKPELTANAVEELLRFDPPLQMTGRQATADIVIGGQAISKGDNISLMIGAANRDTRRWPDGDGLRIDRPDPKPLSFGFGTHHCLGAALARMEVRIAIPALLERLGDYTVDTERIVWKHSFGLRGPLALPLTIAPEHGPTPEVKKPGGRV
ncbi:MAG: cytochrome P450 [Ilumatobacter sp.]|jgi:cytochrome P450